MNISTELMEDLALSLVEEMGGWLAAKPEMGALALENALREAMRELGRICLQAALEAVQERYPQAAVECPCGHRAQYMFQREAKTLSVFGWVSYKRAYYLCSHCHKGQSPFDHEWGLRPGQVSVALASLLGLEGIEAAFEKASSKLEKRLLIEVSENTVRKETQAFGELVQQQEEEQWVESQDEKNLFARRRTIPDPPQRLYGSMDGVQVPIGEEWRELKCGCWYTVDGEGYGEEVGETGRLRAQEISYYCDVAGAGDFRDLVWATGYGRHADVAQEIVFVADGAAWIWKIVKYHFPHAVQIVDWYHALEYLGHIAHVRFEDESQRERWLERATAALWEGEIEQTIAICREHEEHALAGPLVRKAITYYRNNAERMDYARFRQEGYQIGSGTVESACKQIGTQRLKCAGARWSERGARLTAKARAAWLSDGWESLEHRCFALAQAA